MQKKIIALAVAGLVSGAAFAQSNVTIYGVADVGVAQSKAANGSQFRVQSGQSAGSRLGFKGEEGLGNGLKAVWTMEMGLDMTTGQSTCHSMNDNGCGTSTGTTNNNNPQANPANATNNTTGTSVFQRQVFAGLSSATLGTVTIGRQYTADFYVKAKSDVFGLGYAGTANNAWAVSSAFLYDRLDRALQYQTPTWNGFQAMVQYSTGSQNNTDTSTTAGVVPENQGKQWGLNATYTGYGFDVGASYHKLNALAANNAVTAGLIANSAVLPATMTDTPDTNAWMIGGNYDFKVAKVYAGYAASKTTTHYTAASGGDTVTQKYGFWNLGVKVPFGAHSVFAQYSRINDKTSTNADANLWGLGYEYAMSKRTALYAGYAKMDNGNNATYSLGATATNNGLRMVNNDGTTTGLAGRNASEFNFGVRHSF